LRDIAERLEVDPEIEPEDIVAVADTLRRVCGDLGIGLDPHQEAGGWLDAGPPTPLSPRPPGLGLSHIGWPNDPALPPRQAGPRPQEGAAPHPNPPGRDPP